MTNLLRVLHNPEQWAELAESPMWDDGDCPPELLRQIYDNRGISLYEVSSPDDIKRVTSAITISWGTFKPCSFALIPQKSLKQIKIKTQTTPGSTFDKHTNQLHRDVVDISGKQLIAFVKTIKEEAEIQTISKEEIAKNLKENVSNGIFEKNKIFKKDKALEVLRDFWDNDFLDIVIA